MSQSTAAILVIGNEILSGRTQDLNVQYIAKRLAALGIRLAHVSIIPDIEEDIVHHINVLRKQYSYVFTTGGIGPTHDDITSKSVSKAFGVPFEKEPTAYEILLNFYGRDGFTPARQKMAYMPKGATLIDNPVTTAPGYRMENVYVLAGVPKIMQSMFSFLEPTLAQGNPIEYQSVHVLMAESLIAEGLETVQNMYPHLDIGSYPFYDTHKGHGTSLVVKGTNIDDINNAIGDIKIFIKGLGAEPLQDTKDIDTHDS